MDLLIGIGDIHGNLDALECLLRSLDEKYDIFDSKTKLRKGIGIEFNGDFIDRGPESLKVLEFVKELCEKNPLVNAKLGNHELLALGDLDTASEIIKLIKNDELISTLAFEIYRRESIHGINGGTEFVKNFSQDPKEAFSTYVKRMSKNGDLGLWLRKLNPFSIVKIANKKILFTHADISEKLFTKGNLNKFAKEYRDHMNLSTREFSRGSADKYDPHSFLMSATYWGRRFKTMTASDARELANSLGVDYIVVGHTIQTNGISNIGNVIFNIDVGMFLGNDPAAIVFDGEKVIAHYVNKRSEVLVD